MAYIKNICIFIPMLLCSLLLSCKDYEEDNDTTIVKMNDGNSIKCQNGDILLLADTVSFLPVYKHNPSNTFALKGFTKVKQDKTWQKAKIFTIYQQDDFTNEQFYYVRKDVYYQSILSNTSAYQYSEDGDKMGFFKWADGHHSYGYQELLGQDRAYTIIYYIGYDIHGNIVNKYFPCAPEELVWRYSTF